MPKAYAIYTRWFDLLYTWASMLVDDRTARRCARRTLAQMVDLACRGVETMDGPYMASVDILYELLCKQPALHDRIFVNTAFQRMQYPTCQDAYDFATLYSAVYHAAYSASWTSRDKVDVALWVQVHDAGCVKDQDPESWLRTMLPDTHPLRRAVKQAQEHKHGEELICSASSALWESEHVKACNWLARSLEEKGVST